jgi:hypothetical protein
MVSAGVPIDVPSEREDHDDGNDMPPASDNIILFSVANQTYIIMLDDLQILDLDEEGCLRVSPANVLFLLNTTHGV